MANWWDSALGLIGQDQESQVKGDMGDYDRESGTVKREGGQWLFDRLLGRDQGEMDELARDKHLKGLKESQGGRALSTAAGNQLLGSLDTGIHWSDDKQDLLTKAAKVQGILGAKEQAVGMGADAGAVTATNSIGALSNLGSLGADNRQWGSRSNQHSLSRERIADKRTNLLDKIAITDRRDNNLRQARQDRDNYSLRLQDLERLKGQDADRMMQWQQTRADKAHSRKQDLMLAIMQGLNAIPL